MKKARWTLGLVVVAGGSLLWFRTHQSARELSEKPAHLDAQQEEEARVRTAQALVGTKGTSESAGPSNPIDPVAPDHKEINLQLQSPEAQQFASLMADASMLSIFELNEALTASYKVPAEVVQNIILREYASLKLQAAPARGKLLWFAKRRNGPLLYPMWSDILARKTYEGLSMDQMSKEGIDPTADASAEFAEELIAIDSIAHLAESDRQYLDTLQKIVTRTGPYAEASDFQRQAALKQIKKVSYVAFVQTKKSIKDGFTSNEQP